MRQASFYVGQPSQENRIGLMVVIPLEDKLSGDFNVEQHVHFLDVCAWVMKNEYPIRAVGMGGRQVRNGPEFGHIYDHFAVVYEYANGIKLFSNCRQQQASSDWNYTGPTNDLYQTEHDELFASIRSGKPIHNGDYMTKSTLLAIMGRMDGSLACRSPFWGDAWGSGCAAAASSLISRGSTAAGA